MPHDHLETLGLAVLRMRWLPQLRDQLGISRRQLADTIGVSTQTLKRWEEDPANVWKASRTRLGEFYSQSIGELEKVHRLGDEFAGYKPASVVASLLAQPTFVIEKMCRAGELECLNLGILGVYVKGQNLPRSDG